jgi:hypothetical protein
VLVEYLIPLKSNATTQGGHFFFDIDVKGGEKEWSRCYSWRSKRSSTAFEGFHQFQRGILLEDLAGRSVLVIDGKNKRWSRRKRLDIKAQEIQRMKIKISEEMA